MKSLCKKLAVSVLLIPVIVLSNYGCSAKTIVMYEIVGTPEEIVTIGVAGSYYDKADYLCDGSNDAELIQAAIDHLPDSGGAIVVLPGRYYLNDTITVAPHKHRVSFQGSGFGTVFVNTFSSGNLFYIYGINCTESDPEEISIGNFSVEITDAKGPMRVINAEKRHRVLIEKVFVTVKGRWRNNVVGAYLDQCDNSIVSNSSFYRVNVGVYLRNSDDTKVIGCNMTESDSYGIVLSEFTYKCLVIGNTVEESRVGGIHIRGRQNIVSANTFGENGIYGIHLDTSRCIDNVITSNSCIDNGIRYPGYGIYASVVTANNLIMGNTCGNFVSKSQHYGIFDISGRNSIAYNICRGNIENNLAVKDTDLVKDNITK